MPVHQTLLIRALGLYLPAALVVCACLWRRPARGQMVGALLGCAWTLPALLLVHALAGRFGWWSFRAQGGTFQGMPVDLYLGWVLLWGALPILATPRTPLLWMLLLFFGVDLLLMPVCRPVILLGHHWLLGELVAITICLLPAQLLARWTLDRRHLVARCLLQVVAFGSLLLWTLPAIVLEQTHGTWAALFHRPPWINSLALQLLSVPAILGLSAVQEFCERGCGTPVPYDPPRRLVTTGAYAYVANPMQLAMCLLLVGWGAMVGSGWAASAGLVAAAYSAGLAAWDEGSDLRRRFGGRWASYRREVRSWRPRWRPFREASARIYVARSCGKCSAIGGWLAARSPVGLEIAAAEDHPTGDLWRLTYEDGEFGADGVAAFARALEHIHLGWALVGWTLRLPLVFHFSQLLVDVSGGEPMHAGLPSHRGEFNPVPATGCVPPVTHDGDTR